jgi:hypothetical protein
MPVVNICEIHHGQESILVRRDDTHDIVFEILDQPFLNDKVILSAAKDPFLRVSNNQAGL